MSRLRATALISSVSVMAGESAVPSSRRATLSSFSFLSKSDSLRTVVVIFLIIVGVKDVNSISPLSVLIAACSWRSIHISGVIEAFRSFLSVLNGT